MFSMGSRRGDSKLPSVADRLLLKISLVLRWISSLGKAVERIPRLPSDYTRSALGRSHLPSTPSRLGRVATSRSPVTAPTSFVMTPLMVEAMAERIPLRSTLPSGEVTSSSACTC